MPFYWKSVCIGDRRRDVVLGRMESMEGKEVVEGPFDSADTAMRFSPITTEYMAFAKVELIERKE